MATAKKKPLRKSAKLPTAAQVRAAYGIKATPRKAAKKIVRKKSIKVHNILIKVRYLSVWTAIGKYPDTLPGIKDAKHYAGIIGKITGMPVRVIRY